MRHGSPINNFPLSLRLASQLDLAMVRLFVKCFLLFGALVFGCYGDDINKHPFQNMTITDVPVKVYQSKFQCAEQGLSESLNVLSGAVPPTETCMVCNGKEYIKNDAFTNFYSSQHCVEKSYECDNITDLGGKLMEQLEAISKFINLYPTTCLDIKQQNNLSLSGYYTIRLPNGSLISVYCDMEATNCDGKGGWMRIGYLNMSEPNATCPLGLTLRQFDNIDHRLCGRPMSSSIIYSARGFYYSKVCGQIRGYQFGVPDGFPPLHGSNAIPDIDNCNTYVDGVTITYGSNPRKHIWTYACGARETVEGNDLFLPYNCPCNNDSNGTYVPEWVGSEYYCESGLFSDQYRQTILYSNDTLWDGQQCNGNEGPCCTNPKMPWFIKDINETSTEDIELRMCGSENPSNDEDTPLDIIELYIR